MRYKFNTAAEAIDSIVGEIQYRGNTSKGGIDRFREQTRCVLKGFEPYAVECAAILRRYQSGQIPFGGQRQLKELLPLGTKIEEEDNKKFYGVMKKILLAIEESARNGGLPRGSDDLLFDALNNLFFNRDYELPKKVPNRR